MIDQNSMSREDMERARVFGLGLVIGAVAGAAAGLLMAPASGEETRRNLTKGARRVYSRAAESLGDGWEGADRSYRRLKKTGVKRARKQAERARALAEELVGNGRKRMSWR